MTTPRTLAVVAALAVAASACSLTTEVNQRAIDYDYDSWSGDRTKEECVEPGRRAWQDPNDESVIYPADQQKFEFASDPNNVKAARAGAESEALTIGSSDKASMTVEGVVTFYLTNDCTLLEAFDKNIGRKYAANTPEGWQRMILAYLKQPIDRAMEAIGKQYTWEQMYLDPAIKQAFETEVAKKAVEFVTASAGGQYFTNFSFTIQQPQPPEELKKSMESRLTAIQENLAQKERNTQALTKLDLLKEYVKIFGRDGAILYEAVKDGSIQIVPIPADGSVNVSPK